MAVASQSICSTKCRAFCVLTRREGGVLAVPVRHQPLILDLEHDKAVHVHASPPSAARLVTPCVPSDQGGIVAKLGRWRGIWLTRHRTPRIFLDAGHMPVLAGSEPRPP